MSQVQVVSAFLWARDTINETWASEFEEVLARYGIALIARSNFSVIIERDGIFYKLSARYEERDLDLFLRPLGVINRHQEVRIPLRSHLPGTTRREAKWRPAKAVAAEVNRVIDSVFPLPSELMGDGHREYTKLVLEDLAEAGFDLLNQKRTSARKYSVYRAPAQKKTHQLIPVIKTLLKVVGIGWVVLSLAGGI